MNDTTTPQQLREQARECRRRAYESFENCDTDGFLSQWASNITADELEMKADLLEKDNVSEFTALFTATGELIPDAREVETRFGWAWVHKVDGQSVWFNPSKAKNEDTRRFNNLKKGYYLGRVLAKARVKIIASGTGLSGAASARPGIVPDYDMETKTLQVVEIIDNGL
jgi:hypothetical protein